MNLELDKIFMALVTASLGLFFWQIKTALSRLSSLIIDVAVIKSITESIRQDHDDLVVVKQKIEKHENDLRNTNDKLRRIYEPGEKTRNL